MARGNQREKSREANLKKQAAQKKGNNLSGTEMQRSKEAAAEIMRQKQAAGMSHLCSKRFLLIKLAAEAKKAAADKK
ncbi:4F5 domain protein [Emericellopsis cladophorae]|uniref:4F5 domain protein n=1 Tax=Emericellopsis cladophorae TaxID=2686198 RepID=A0A9Q0BE60_9HYPO|nr:4F5 domain protein [Emericellopsis cladophorae]KAI6781521.1 4F5 domain protein [Emericellopsis cladophorae]